MDAKQFVADLRAMNTLWVDGFLKQMASPEGRHEEVLLLSDWYNRQTSEDQERVALALQRATEGALFGVLGVLDGIVTLPSAPESGHLELTYVSNGQRHQLNEPEGEYLSDYLSNLLSRDE